MNQAAKVAANWWGDAVCGKARDDAGDGMINMARSLIDARKPAVALTARDHFVAALETSIAARVESFGEVGLHVDYGPEGLLFDVLKTLDREHVRGFSWPAKTRMSVSANDVTVSNGYRARNQRLYGDPQWSVVMYPADYRGCLVPYHGANESEARDWYAKAKDAAAGFPGAKVNLECDGNSMDGNDD